MMGFGIALLALILMAMLGLSGFFVLFSILYGVGDIDD